MSTKSLARYLVATPFLFAIWRSMLFTIHYLGQVALPLQHRFLFGGYWEYIKNPLLYAWANFDGNHYLTIATRGYELGRYSFFPFYPKTIAILSNIFQISSTSGNVTIAITISHLCLLLGLVGFFKLLRLDLNYKLSLISVIFLLIFPTSFYFASAYTESIFLAFCVWSFYFARKSKWLFAGILGGLASITRFPGILLLPCLILEYFYQYKFSLDITKLKKAAPILLIPAGTLTYMYYLYIYTSSPLTFFTELPAYGEQRSSKLILLPQVIYRYLFKIIPNLNIQTFPYSFPIILEFSIAILVLIAIILGYKKIRLSYWSFLTLGFLSVSLTGSFSSLPRYTVVLFPFFMILAKLLIHKKILLLVYVLTSTILLIFSELLFLSGYWLA